VRNILRNKKKSMTFGSYAFLWRVAVDGCIVLDASTHKTVVDVENIKEVSGIDGSAPWLVSLGNMARQYAPLSKPTLHREFASLYNNESIVKFANRYGLLGQYAIPLMPIGGGTMEFGESIERWKYESREMGILLYIWDLFKGQYTGKLSQLIKWTSGVIIEYKYEYDDKLKEWQALPAPSNDIISGVAFTSIAGPHQHNELLERWKWGEVMEPARYYVCREINKHLEGHVTPQIFPFLNSRIYLHPDSLLAAMWVMFSLEILGDTKPRRCDICGKWQVQNLERSSFYCSSACRQEAYRRRRRSETQDVSENHPISAL